MWRIGIAMAAWRDKAPIRCGYANGSFHSRQVLKPFAWMTR